MSDPDEVTVDDDAHLIEWPIFLAAARDNLLQRNAKVTAFIADEKLPLDDEKLLATITGLHCDGIKLTQDEFRKYVRSAHGRRVYLDPLVFVSLLNILDELPPPYFLDMEFRTAHINNMHPEVRGIISVLACNNGGTVSLTSMREMYASRKSAQHCPTHGIRKYITAPINKTGESVSSIIVITVLGLSTAVGIISGIDLIMSSVLKKMIL